MVEGLPLVAAEGVVEVEGEVSALGEGVAVDQHHLRAGEEQHPARGILLGEEAAEAARPVAGAQLVLGVDELAARGAISSASSLGWPSLSAESGRQNGASQMTSQGWL